jgi:hypothetical protein
VARGLLNPGGTDVFWSDDIDQVVHVGTRSVQLTKSLSLANWRLQ